MSLPLAAQFFFNCIRQNDFYFENVAAKHNRLLSELRVCCFIDFCAFLSSFLSGCTKAKADSLFAEVARIEWLAMQAEKSMICVFTLPFQVKIAVSEPIAGHLVNCGSHSGFKWHVAIRASIFTLLRFPAYPYRLQAALMPNHRIL